MNKQLPLGVVLRDGASFDNYVSGENDEALSGLRACAEGRENFVYLWGASGCGKTHLLHALSRQLSHQGETVVYLPLSDAEALAPQALAGLEDVRLVCLDDLNAIAGKAAWEEAIFHLYNRLREQGNRLVVAADRPPAALGLALPDLQSRMTAGLVYHLRTLDDAQKAAALQLRASRRGIDLPPDVAGFMLRRCPRDMASLFDFLDHLDLAALAAQRRLTIPFVRQMLDEPDR